MKTTVDRLSGELCDRYRLYIETLTIDLWIEEENAVLGCGFVLRSDHILRSVTFKVRAKSVEKEPEREMLVGAVFKQLEMLIDLAIAEEKLPD